MGEIDPDLEYALKIAMNDALGGNYVYTQEEIREHNIKTEPLNIDQIFGIAVGRADIKPMILKGLLIGATALIAPAAAAFEIFALRSFRKKQIFIRTVSGKTIAVECNSSDTVGNLKNVIENREGVPVDQQRIMFRGKELEDHKTLSECKIDSQSTLHLLLRIRGGSDPKFHIDPSFADKSYDYDFTTKDDTGKTHRRGGRTYVRPIGSMRYAIKVRGKYENDKWLDQTGDASSGEWPVAYHGTTEGNATSILKTGFDLKFFQNGAYGKGHYCTPDPKTAKKYADLRSCNRNGNKLTLLFQVRVNPANIKEVKPDTKDKGGDGEYWMLEEGKDLRPYGLVLYKN